MSVRAGPLGFLDTSYDLDAAGSGPAVRSMSRGSFSAPTLATTERPDLARGSSKLPNRGVVQPLRGLETFPVNLTLGSMALGLLTIGAGGWLLWRLYRGKKKRS